MPAGRALLTRGRGAVLALAGAVVASFAVGWLRGLLLPASTAALLALPWAPARRIGLGLLLDLPTLAALALLCLVASRVLAVRPVPGALSLLAATVGLDLLVAALVAADWTLWTDPFVLAGRLPALAAAALLSALALGSRRAPRPASPAGEPGNGDGSGGDGSGDGGS